MKYLFVIAAIVLAWLLLTLWACLALAKSADQLIERLQKPRKEKRHNLIKWLKFHGRIY